MRRAAVAVVCLLALGCVRGPRAEPGELVSDDPVTIQGGTATRIRYGSVNVRGGRSEVTGLVAVPPGEPPPEGWPVAAWAHATTGGADACAPSRDPSLTGVGDMLIRLADAGFVAVATDYEGIGTRGDHPYLHGRSEAQAVVDSVRAARALVPAAGRRWAVLGHSQGGHAAAFTAELAPELAPELELVGAVAFAPVAEPSLLIDNPHFLALAVTGYLTTQPDVDEEELLTPDGQDAVDAARDECEVAPPAGPMLARFEEGFDAYVHGNAIGQQPTPVPLLILQGSDDELTVPGGARRAARRLCQLEVAVALREYDGADHLDVLDSALDDAMAWVADRFAGIPAASTCAV